MFSSSLRAFRRHLLSFFIGLFILNAPVYASSEAAIVEFEQVILSQAQIEHFLHHSPTIIKRLDSLAKAYPQAYTEEREPSPSVLKKIAPKLKKIATDSGYKSFTEWTTISNTIALSLEAQSQTSMDAEVDTARQNIETSDLSAEEKAELLKQLEAFSDMSRQHTAIPANKTLIEPYRSALETLFEQM